MIHISSHTLILGSMPSKISIKETQYYAHPRNGFWHIMGELFDAGPDKQYEERLAVLQTNGIALWDVIRQCTRSTSLDSDIAEGSIVTNDFDSLFYEFSRIERIFFNGGKAEQSFKRYVLPHISQSLNGISFKRLTSTSPANARHTLADKIELWRSSIL